MHELKGRNYRMNATFTAPRSARSLRLHFLMEKQQRLEIGERIRELRENSAETNRSIADYVGVGERSVAAWIAGGGIAWDNAKKVAELFGVDVDYVWRGTSKGATPDVIGALNGASELDARLDRMEQALLALRTSLAEIGVELQRRKAPEHQPQRSKPAEGK
jgi:transcriptional regulator with XRE-family HTH domain